MKYTHIKVNPEDKAKLKEIAKIQGISMLQLIHNYVNKVNPEPLKDEVNPTKVNPIIPEKVNPIPAPPIKKDKYITNSLGQKVIKTKLGSIVIKE